MAVIRSKFSEDQMAKRKTASRGAKMGGPALPQGSPLLKMVIISVVLIMLYAVGAMLVISDFKPFFGGKPLPMPKVAQQSPGLHTELNNRVKRGIFQKKKEYLTVQELNQFFSGHYGTDLEATLQPGQPLPTKPADIFATDSKGNLILLLSLKLGESGDYVNAVLLFTPVGPVPEVQPGMPLEPRELMLTKIHANGVPLSDAAVGRIGRLIRIIYQQIEGFSGEMYTRGMRNDPNTGEPTFAGDPEKKLVIKYANSTLYFNGFEP